MDDWLARLVETTEDLRRARTLEDLLRLIVERASQLLGTDSVSIRLFDKASKRLVAHTRTGDSLHTTPAQFFVGEGLIGAVAESQAPLRTGAASKDPRFAPRAGLREPMESFLGVPLLEAHRCLGVLAAVSAEPEHFTVGHERILQILATLSAPHLEVARLARLACTDPLTGVLNRLGFDNAIGPTLVLFDGRPVSIAICDLDHFKLVNDQWGHPVGDLVLRRVASLLSGVLRSTDSVVRWGGEEFLLVLPGAELERARRIVERARFHVEQEELEVGPSRVSVTISAGVAEHRSGEDGEATVRRADQALYEAKSRGRNQVAQAG